MLCPFSSRWIHFFPIFGGNRPSCSPWICASATFSLTFGRLPLRPLRAGGSGGNCVGALCVVEPLKILTSVGLSLGPVLELLLLWLENEDLSKLDIQVANDKEMRGTRSGYHRITNGGEAVAEREAAEIRQTRWGEG
jgi:hypothetical protein